MAGLLSDVLPYLYSQGDRLKRHAKGLLADPAGTMAQTAGLLGDKHREQQGLMAQAFADPKAPFRVTDDAAMMRAAQAMLNGPLGMAPVGRVAKVAPAVDEAARLRRMTEQGFEPGWWRGGRSVADGPHYTPDRAAAEAFAARHGPAADVREYAISAGNQFDLARTYGPEDLKKLRDVLKDQYGSKYADELLSIPSDFRNGRAPGGHIYQAVEQLSGGNGKDALKAAGFDTLNAGQELIVLNRAGTVRDKNLARFDPKKRLSADPFAAIAGGAIGLGLLNQTGNGE